MFKLIKFYYKYQFEIFFLFFSLFLIFPNVFPQTTINSICQSIGQWGDWSDWQSCMNAAPININIQRRIRICIGQPNGCNSAFECPGPYSQVISCNTTTLAQTTTTTQTTTTPLKTSTTTTQTTISPQTSTTTTQTTISPQTSTTTTQTTISPQTTITTTLRSLPTTISFIVINTTTIATRTTTVVPCGTWNNWMDWSECTLNCGGCGTTQRFRSCATAPICNCTGTAFEKKLCNTQVCIYPTPACCSGYSPSSVNNTFTCVPSNTLITTTTAKTRKK